MPITVLDGKPVRDGKLGPITKKIWDGYWAMHYDPAFSFEISYASSPNQSLVNGAAKALNNGLVNGAAKHAQANGEHLQETYVPEVAAK